MEGDFPGPADSKPDLLIIAGEHSGDQHAAKMLKGLKEKSPGLNVYALGGKELEAAGAQLLYDTTEHAVMGFVEVLKNYRFLKKTFEKTVRWIKEYKPRVVCFVDYPGFNLRVAKRLYKEGISVKSGGGVKLCYYIGPQIWAWKAKRRFAMARYLDALGVIFPFEVDCYKDTDLPVQFVGHPFVAEGSENSMTYDADGPIILLPGSRRAVVARIFPAMLDAFQRLLKEYPEEKAVVVYPSEEIGEVLRTILSKRGKLKGKVELCLAGTKLLGKALLTSSGTMSLSCALAGIPGAIVYKAHPVTYWLGRMLLKVPYIGIANLLLNKAVYPEFIQGAASGKQLAKELLKCIESGERRAAIMEDARLLREKLSMGGEGSMDAAEWLEDVLGK